MMHAFRNEGVTPSLTLTQSKSCSCAHKPPDDALSGRLLHVREAVVRVHLTIFGGALLDLDINGTDDTDEEHLTFGFASVAGNHEISDDRALDASDAKRR